MPVFVLQQFGRTPLTTRPASITGISSRRTVLRRCATTMTDSPRQEVFTHHALDGGVRGLVER